MYYLDTGTINFLGDFEAGMTTTDNLRLVIVNQVKDIPRKQWDEIFPADIIEGYAYYRAIDESNLPLFLLYYAIVYENNRIVCIAPFFITNFSLDTTIQGYFKNIVSSIQKILPKLFRMKILFFGSPLTEEGIIGFAKDCDVKQTLNFLIQEIIGFCKNRKISVITFYNLTTRDMHIVDLLKINGFGCMEAFPLARLEIKERSLEEYIQNLGRSTRKNIRQKLRNTYASAEITIEERDNLNGLLNQAYKLYLDTYNRGDVSFEKLTLEYFSKISEHMPDVTKFFIVWINHKMVAFNLCFVKDGFCIDKYFGLDYEVAYRYNLYYLTWCHNIDWCIKHGVRYYQPGTCDYEPKIRLGGKLIPLYVCCRFLNSFVNCFTAPVLKLITPKNFDPVLRNLRKI